MSFKYGSKVKPSKVLDKQNLSFGSFPVIYITSTQSVSGKECVLKDLSNASATAGISTLGRIHTLGFSYDNVKFSDFFHGSPSPKLKKS